MLVPDKGMNPRPSMSGGPLPEASQTSGVRGHRQAVGAQAAPAERGSPTPHPAASPHRGSRRLTA